MTTFAERLDHLVRTMHPAGRGPFTNAELADKLGERGYAVAPSYLSQIRRGVRGSSGVGGGLLIALADLFGVDPRYFYDADVAEETNKELELLAALRDTGVQRIAMRSMELSPEGLDAVESLIEHLQKVDGMHATPSRKKRRGSGNRGSGKTAD